MNRSIVLLACALVALAAGLLQPPSLEASPSIAPALQTTRVIHLNPVLDTNNRTAKLAVELILSACGKSIL